MARRILYIVAGGVLSIPLCLFLGLVLEWPTVFVYMVGMTPLFAAASVMPPADRKRGNGRR